MWSIAYIGEVAHACLSRHHQGVVDSVFERSAYIVFNDTYLCIALSSVGRGPLNILYGANNQSLHCAFRSAAAVRFCHADQTLRIDGIVIARLVQARICDSTARLSTSPVPPMSSFFMIVPSFRFSPDMAEGSFSHGSMELSACSRYIAVMILDCP